MDAAAAEFFASHVTFTANSWEQCVEYLGFTVAEFRGGVLAGRWPSSPVTVADKRRIFLELAGDPKHGATLRQWLGDRVALGARYLREAGLMKPGKAALVDSGWSGTWTDIMADLIEKEGGTRPEVFFLGRRRLKQAPRTPTHCFLFDHQLGTGLDSVPAFFHVVIEFLLTANHGRTTGFRERDGAVVPVLGPRNLQGFSEEEWVAYRRALVRFAQLHASEIPDGRTPPDLRRALVDLTALLWERPTRGEAELLGRHTFGLSPTADADRQLARPYRTGDLGRLICRFRLPGYAPHWWHEGALALTPSAALRVAMAALWQLREMLRALHAARWLRIGCHGFSSLLRESARRVWRAARVVEDHDCPQFDFAKRTQGAAGHVPAGLQESSR
jgi:hypothetical protein